MVQCDDNQAIGQMSMATDSGACDARGLFVVKCGFIVLLTRHIQRIFRECTTEYSLAPILIIFTFHAPHILGIFGMEWEWNVHEFGMVGVAYLNTHETCHMHSTCMWNDSRNVLDVTYVVHCMSDWAD